MTPNLAQLKELATKATPGEWENGNRNDGVFMVLCYQKVSGRVNRRVHPISTSEPCDAEYIAAANPETILELIDRIEKLEEVLKWYAEEERYFDPRLTPAAMMDCGQRAREALNNL